MALIVIWLFDKKYGCLFFVCRQVQLIDTGFHEQDTNWAATELALRTTLPTKSLLH